MTMDFRQVSILVFCFLILSTNAIKQSYVVYMGSHRLRSSHHQFLSSFLTTEESIEDAIIYSYTRDINGFAARLDEDQAAAIANHSDVVSVFLNKPKQLHTTHSWDFLSLQQTNTYSSILWKNANYGEDIIVANLDTGVWPESKSFSDDGYSLVPARWKGRCQNESFVGVHCNRKLIGARFFNKGFIVAGGKLPQIQNSARDFEGHGSHTLSTAGGNFVTSASLFGVGNGTAKGGSPRARVASYKVCWPQVTFDIGGCYDNDILKAMDTAIHDGVDVLSISIGTTPTPYFEDSVAIAALHAVKNGIVIVCSAGNEGINIWTAQNLAPWLITVAASSTDREFQTLVKLGNGQSFQGSSLTKGLSRETYPLISADQAVLNGSSSSDALLCMNGTLDPAKVDGKIIVCISEEIENLGKGLVAAQAGAVGMILCNDEAHGNKTHHDPHILSAAHLSYNDCVAIFAYIKSTKNPTGYIGDSETVINSKPAPYMASFSSKGPNRVTPVILKPDITAPGVNIIAAYSEYESTTTSEIDPRRAQFFMGSGTSMATPHVAGVVGLIKKVHPNWSPAAIKSSIMTTAKTIDTRGKPILYKKYAEATPLNYGSGHIHPNRAINPGLVYDLTVNDHLDFLCAIGYNESKIRLFSVTPYNCPKNPSVLNYNYPSMTIPDLTKPASLTRTLKNVGPPGTYVATVIEPPGISIILDPPTLKFEKIGEEKSFVMSLKKKKSANITSEFIFGKLSWSDGKHYVRSPITVSFGPKIPSIEETREIGFRKFQ